MAEPNNRQLLKKLSQGTSESASQSWISLPNGSSIKNILKKANTK